MSQKSACECGHEKRDHRSALMGGEDECKVCLCRHYTKVSPPAAAPPAETDEQSQAPALIH